MRLHVARERMLHDGMDAASAAFEVGYESSEPVQSGIQQILRPAADARYKKPASRGFYFEKLV
jgi:AraC-like DNA-binding protein